MASLRSTSLLVPAFRDKVEHLLTSLASVGHDVRLSCTRRTPWEQARLWRQSRSREEIGEEVSRLIAGEAPTLAEYIVRAGPQFGKTEVTRAIPGLSWHQWDEAVDAFVVIDGKANWGRESDDAFREYAEEAKALGLTAAYFFKGRAKESPHVQLRPQGSPADTMTLRQIDNEMRIRFGVDEEAYLKITGLKS